MGGTSADQNQLLSQLRQLLGSGDGSTSGSGGQTGSGGGQGSGSIPATQLLELLAKQVQGGASAASGQSQGASAAADSGSQPGSTSGGGQGPEASIPIKKLLELVVSGTGQSSAGGGGSSGSAGGGGSTEMQLSQELAANLKKLKAIIQETQSLAERIEATLAQGPGGQGKSQNKGSSPSSGQSGGAS